MSRRWREGPPLLQAVLTEVPPAGPAVLSVLSGAEDDAGGGAVSVEFALLVDNPSFSCSGAAANVNRVCFTTD